MKKMNCGGFALVETMVVSVFVMAILSIIYVNFYPIMGEYERREAYDDLDGKYAAYWFKRLIQSGPFVTEEMKKNIKDNGVVYFFTCDKISDPDKKTLCKQLYEDLEVAQIYLTSYDTTRFKEYANSGASSISGGLQEYTAALPKYHRPSLNDAEYRLIIEFYRKKHLQKPYRAYATIEVKV